MTTEITTEPVHNEGNWINMRSHHLTKAKQLLSVTVHGPDQIMGRYNTRDTHFIISPRQSQISVLTGAHAAHKKSSLEGSWVGWGKVDITITDQLLFQSASQ